MLSSANKQLMINLGVVLDTDLEKTKYKGSKIVSTSVKKIGKTPTYLQ